MAGFYKKYSQAADPQAWTKNLIIVNSGTLTVGDVVELSSGFVAAGTAGDRLLGFVTGFVTKDGGDLLNATSGTDYDGTYTDSTLTYVASADNQTDKQVKAVIDMDPTGVWSGAPDATIGTTTGSNLFGYYTDIADEDEVDESTAATTAAQLFIHGLDPDDSTRGLYSIAEGYFAR